MRRANEVASGCIDTGRNSRGFGARGFGARPTEAQESALGPALVAISEDASGVNERRVLRDDALVFAGADPHVRSRV
ncbi:MAG TPA: hypothetical protein PK156_43530 [Polyangium sp.]|nr:hypothetical protein [Polyangium sp.]